MSVDSVRSVQFIMSCDPSRIYKELYFLDQPAPSPAVRPVPANLRAFMFRFAHKRGEDDDLVKGYYFAADLLGCQHVMYHLPTPAPDQPPQPTRCLVTPYQDCFARVDMQRPHDLNAIARLICKVPRSRHLS